MLEGLWNHDMYYLIEYSFNLITTYIMLLAQYFGILEQNEKWFETH